MLALKARTFLALGVTNVARVGLYRLGLRSGFGRARRIKAKAAQGPFFTRTPPRTQTPPPSEAWRDEAIYFGHLRIPLSGSIPDWFANPYTGKRLPSPTRAWWNIPDFDPEAGDIKVIWELSRFDWLIASAARAAAGDEQAWNQMETWLSDWCNHNQPYCGPNWKCGQETSIRVMHLAMAALILQNHHAPTPGLMNLIEAHLKRIEPTVQYAIGQDNNHGTSEAAALFIGGSWLQAGNRPGGQRWMRLGRRLLENRVLRLVAEDGSFSQYSLTYHRVLIDTLVMAETWRRRLDLPDFPTLVRDRMAKAAKWLFAMTDSISGDGPNLGNNDGARLLPLTDTGYRDFRPSIQTAMVLFEGVRAYRQAGPWDDPIDWLGLTAPHAAAEPPASIQFNQGGYSVLRNKASFALLRYPRFRFRPAQADALHVDLWVSGKNILRDAGTYSYGGDAAILDNFGGTRGHSTVLFDERDQMPRLGRFLFGAWLSARNVTFDESRCVASAGYVDWRGAEHHRSIHLSADRLHVVDRVGGAFSKAVLRWRLASGKWRVEGDTINDGTVFVRVSADVPIKRFELVTTDESLHYLEKHPIPVLEVEVHSPTHISSEISWK